MRRFLAFAVLAALVTGGVALRDRLDQARQYRHLLAESELAIESGQSYQAIEKLSGALVLRPTSMAAYYLRGKAYRQQRQYDQALRDLREAQRLAPDAPEPLIALGELFDERGDLAQAAHWYGEAADRLKDANPGLLYALGLAWYRAGNPAAAKDPLRRALAASGSMAEAHYLLGLVYRDAQNPDDAIAALEQAVRIAPTLVPARKELADLYRVRERHVDEMAQLQALAVLDPRVDRRIDVALADLRAHQFDAAIEKLSYAAASTPNDSRIALAVGRVHLARAEHDGDHASIPLAVAVLEQALGGTARRSEGLALYGRALYLSGDAANAERILIEATATSPVDLEAFAFLADAAEHLSHHLVALNALLDLDALEGNLAASAVRADRARRIAGLRDHLGRR